MTSLNLSQYGIKADLPVIVRASKRQGNDETQADEAAEKEQRQTDLFHLAREIYLRAQQRKMYRRASGII